MAFLKNSVVAGDLRVTGTIYGDANLSSINANNTGLGTNGQILTSTGTGIAWSSSVAPSSHSHGNITNAGAIGTAADKGVYTTTNGVLTAGTIPVAAGGTGATTFTSGALLIGNGTSAIGTRTIKNMTAAGNLGWTAAATDIYIPTVNTLAYWNGRYNSTSSNLQYCNKGEFGNAVTYGVDDATANGALGTGTGLTTERSVYYGLVTVNNASQTRATGIYAPTSAGTAGYILKSSGGTAAPVWLQTLPIANGGTGATTAAAALTNLGAAASNHNHDSTYVNVSGDTMTGGLNLANNTWNKVGDDAQIGDINKGGHIGVQGLNGNTGIFFTTYNQTTKTTGGAITWDGSKFSITGTVDTSISGNAATATKLGTATVGSANRGIYLNAGTPTALTWYPNSVAVNSSNTNNYPWHRVATVNLGTSSYVDKDAILFIRSRYNGGKYGIIKISARANNATTNPKQSVDISAGWIVRYAFAVGDIRIAKQGLSGESAQVDVYVKCGAYMRAIAYFEEGSNNGWSLVASSEVADTTASDKKTSVEVWADITTSQGAITYDTVKDATDIGIVSHANTAGTWQTGRTLTIGSTGKSVNGSANVSWTLAEIGAAASNHNHDSSYLKLSGGTMTGVITAKASAYADDGTTCAIDMKNSNIIGLNSIYTADASDNAGEGIHFYRDATHVDTLWMNGGDILFVPNRVIGTGTSKADSQKVGRFTANPTSGQVVVTDGTTGGMKSSGYTIAKSVPSDAVFTDTNTKVNVVARGTTKAYLLADTTAPTSTAAAHTAVAETAVYLDTTAGKLVATSFAGNGSALTNLNGSNIASGTVPIARIPTGTSGSTVALGNHTHNYAGSSSAGGAATNATTTADTTNALYVVGVASGATTTLKHDTNLLIKNNVLYPATNGTGSIGDTNNRFQTLLLTNQVAIKAHTAATMPSVVLQDENSKTYVQLAVITKGTTSVEGIGDLLVGNNVATGTAGNATGRIRMYGSAGDYAYTQYNSTTQSLDFMFA